MYNTRSYPTQGTKLTEKKSRSRYLVKIDSPTNASAGFYSYSDMFFKAARTLATELLNGEYTTISQLDTYIFPLAFLYRHSLELVLKAIAFQNITSKEDQIEFLKSTRHNPKRIMENILSKYKCERGLDEILWLQQFFCDIDAIDKKSDSFRYPFHIVWDDDGWGDKLYSISLVFSKQTHLNLTAFANKFEAAFEILNKWYTQDLSPAVEWKEVNTILFEEGGSYYEQAVVGYKFSRQPYYAYVEGYLEAAGFLRTRMKEARDSNSDDNSDLFLPVCYILRNCIELILKDVWFDETGETLKTRCEMILDKKHSIYGLWNIIRKYSLQYANGDGDLEFISNIDNYCQQIHDFDADANKFRYPYSNSMEPYFKERRKFDFINVTTFMESIVNAIRAIEATIENIRDYEAEMQSEYAEQWD